MPSSQSANELLRKVRKIEIRTRALSHQIFAGEYHSAFKGRGMAFSEVREYQYGDDPRSMDWNVTARLRAPYVKVYEEEREMTVVLLIDISRSGLFGTEEKTKRDLLAEIAAVLRTQAEVRRDRYRGGSQVSHQRDEEEMHCFRALRYAGCQPGRDSSL